MNLGGLLTLKPENEARKLARFKRWRAAGWSRFTLLYSVLASLAIGLPVTVLMGFFTGFGFWYRLALLLPAVFAMNLFGSQVMWWSTIPVGIEEIEDPDPGRKALRREGSFLYFAGLVAASAAAFLPLHLGRIAAAPDIMLVVAGLVIAVWGLGKMQRYWRTAPGWSRRSWGARFCRSYVLVLVLVCCAATVLVRVYACYGESEWALPVRRLIK